MTTQSSMAQVVTKAWLKRPMPGLNMTAAYLTLENTTKKPLILEKVTGPDAEVYEIHTHLKVNGVMKMRKLDYLTIKPGKIHQLKPMGDHIMLLNMPRGAFTKKTSQITLHFKDGSRKIVELPVKK